MAPTPYDVLGITENDYNSFSKGLAGAVIQILEGLLKIQQDKLQKELESKIITVDRFEEQKKELEAAFDQLKQEQLNRKENVGEKLEEEQKKKEEEDKKKEEEAEKKRKEEEEKEKEKEKAKAEGLEFGEEVEEVDEEEEEVEVENKKVKEKTKSTIESEDEEEDETQEATNAEGADTQEETQASSRFDISRGPPPPGGFKTSK